MARRGHYGSGKVKYAPLCKRCDSCKKNREKKKRRRRKANSEKRYGVIDVTDFSLEVIPTNGVCRLQEFTTEFVNAVNGVWYERTNK